MQKEFAAGMSEIFSVDRIQGEAVICEDEEENEYVFAISDIIGNVKEGDLIRRINDKKLVFDKSETEKRKQEILDLKKYIYATKKEKR